MLRSQLNRNRLALNKTSRFLDDVVCVQILKCRFFVFLYSQRQMTYKLLFSPTKQEIHCKGKFLTKFISVLVRDSDPECNFKTCLLFRVPRAVEQVRCQCLTVWNLDLVSCCIVGVILPPKWFAWACTVKGTFSVCYFPNECIWEWLPYIPQ